MRGKWRYFLKGILISLRAEMVASFDRQVSFLRLIFLGEHPSRAKKAGVIK